MEKVIFESTVKYGSTIHYKDMSLHNVTKIDYTERELSNGQKFYIYSFVNNNNDNIATSTEYNILTINKDEYFAGDTYKLC